MEKVLTIAIPSYNVEKTLEETIRSLLFDDPTLLQLLEIIIVNDGSKDKTPQIGERLEKEYPTIIKLLNKENGGHGSTINAAIQIAQGKYFRVVDGDDWLLSSNLKRLLQFLHESDVDIVGNDYYRVIDGTEIKSYVKASTMQSNQIFSFDEIYKQYSFSMHAVTIKSILLRDKNLLLDENCFYVDVEYDTYLVYHAKTVLYLDYPVYMYRVGQAQQSVSADGWWRHRDNHATVVKSLIRFYQNFEVSNSQEEGKKAYFKSKVIKSFAGHYTIIQFFDRNKRKVYKKELELFDSSIKKDYGENIYQLISDDRFVSLCRRTKFNDIVITFARVLFLIKERLKKIIGRA